MKDYQGLFDYETTAVRRTCLELQGSALVGKQEDEMVAEEGGSAAPRKALSGLFRVEKKEHFYEVHPVLIERGDYTLQRPFWMIVRTLPHQVFALEEKDIIKLGKQKFKVRDILLDSGPVSASEVLSFTQCVYEDLQRKPTAQAVTKSVLIVPTAEALSEATATEQVCRICLDPGDPTNPLITPCKCTGTVKYIHLKCLRCWLSKKLQVVKQAQGITVNWQPLLCEICQMAFRYRIYIDNQRHYTVEIPRPPKPYIVLEAIKKHESAKNKVFHFISFAQKTELNLGRKKGIDIRISEDISVSRIHANLMLKEDAYGKLSVMIKDCESKFGTLILLRKPLQVRPRLKGISFQVEADVYSFEALRGVAETSASPTTPDLYPNAFLGEEDEDE